MPYPMSGESGKITSVTNSTDLDQLLETALRNTQIVFQCNGPLLDSSGDGGTQSTFAAGLRDWSFNFTGTYPKSAPRIGASGSVVYASGSTYYVSGWTMNIDFGEHEITAMDGTASNVWRQYRPSIRPIVSGTYVARASSAAALTLPNAAYTDKADATFKLAYDTPNVPSFTALVGDSQGILVSQLGFTTGHRGLVEASYAYSASGGVKSVAGSNFPALLPAGVVVMPDWGDGTTGPDTVAVVFELDSSRTWTSSGSGNWSYLRSLSINAMAPDLVTVTGVVRGSGGITPA